MNIKLIQDHGIDIAVVSSDELLVTDAQSALDLMMTVKYETGARRIALSKDLVTKEFFILSSGLAGEVLQKFVNYQFKVAIYGDYFVYTSKPLHDFIYESNQGKDVFFPATEEEAITYLTQAL